MILTQEEINLFIALIGPPWETRGALGYKLLSEYKALLKESSMQHTPGPWIVSYEREQPIQVEAKIDGNWAPIAIVKNRIPWSPNGSGNVEDNARLIAASPDLLEACKDLLTVVERQGLKRMTGDSKDSNWMMLSGISKVLDDTRKAIAKAEGKYHAE